MKNLEGSSLLTLAEPESEPGQHSTIQNSGGKKTGSKPASLGLALVQNTSSAEVPASRCVGGTSADQNLEEPMFQSDGGGGRLQLGTFSVDSLQFPVASSVVLALCPRCSSSSAMWRPVSCPSVRPSVAQSFCSLSHQTFSMWDWGDVKVHKLLLFPPLRRRRLEVLKCMRSSW